MNRRELLCAEKDPLDCHRMILVARHASRFAEIRHILGDGMIETHHEAENRLLRRFGMDALDLFRSRDDMLVEAYTRRGEEIAHVESNPASARR